MKVPIGTQTTNHLIGVIFETAMIDERWCKQCEHKNDNSSDEPCCGCHLMATGYEKTKVIVEKEVKA